MSEEIVDTLRDLYDAYRRRDARAILSIFSPEVEIYQTQDLPWGGKYVGYQGAREFFAKLSQYIDSQVDLEQIIPAGNHFVAVAHTRGAVKATGAPFDIPAVHVWRFRDGKVVKFEAYIDTPLMLEALEH